MLPTVKNWNFEGMNFGKLPDISRVDFTLPSDHERTSRVLARATAKYADSQPRIYIGATGWGNKEWLGKWYPARTKPIDFLTHYTRQFNTIEFNMTHYRIPDAEMVDRWRMQAAAGFVFCPKVPQQISHRARLRAEEPTLRFAEVMAGLGERLGPSFIQLPDHHGPKDLDLIRDYLKMWPDEQRLHWELRHPDWFGEGNGIAERGFDALEAAGHGTVITDVAGRRDVLHMQLTTPVLMLRFVGNGSPPNRLFQNRRVDNPHRRMVRKGAQGSLYFYPSTRGRASTRIHCLLDQGFEQVVEAQHCHAKTDRYCHSRHLVLNYFLRILWKIHPQTPFAVTAAPSKGSVTGATMTVILLTAFWTRKSCAISPSSTRGGRM
jgi:uncharacterized protein YecE (DUF72 family)